MPDPSLPDVHPIPGDPSLLPAVTETPSPVLDPEATRVPTSHQLPPHRDKMGRMGDHVAALSADLRIWTELQIALIQRKIEGVVGIFDRIKHFLPALKFYIPGALLAIVGLMFLLVTIALGIGAAIGSYWLGFLITTLLLFAGGGALIYMGYRKQRATEAIVAKIKEDQKKENAPTRDAVADTERLAARQSTV